MTRSPSRTGAVARTRSRPPTSPEADAGTAPAQRSPTVADRRRAQLLADPRVRCAGALLGVLFAMAVWPGLFTTADPRVCHLADSLGAPTWGHPLGFDVQGCDVWARAVHGARTSLVLGLSVAGVALVVGGTLGLVAGSLGGATDVVISRTADTWMGLPLELVGLLILSLFEQRGVPLVVVVLALFAWPSLARLVRSAARREREAPYVEAARALGAGRRRITLRHLLPNVLPVTYASTAVLAGISIATEATLTYFGVGLQMPTMSWGQQLASIRDLGGHPALLAPGVLLTLSVLAFVLLGEAVRDTTDPRGER